MVKSSYLVSIFYSRFTRQNVDLEEDFVWMTLGWGNRVQHL